MNVVDIAIGRKKWRVEIPSSWEECSPKLYLRVCWLLVTGRNDTPSMRKWLVKYTGMPRRAVARMSENEINTILQLLAWSVTPPMHASDKFKWWWIWRAPTNAFQSVSALQYGHADERFNSYQKAVKEHNLKAARKALAELTAILMTPFGKAYRPRVASAQMIFLKLMPLRRQMALLYEFWGMTNFMSEHFKLTFKRKEKKNGNDYGWPGLYENMAGPKFGPMSQVKRENIYDIFLHVEQELQREVELKRNQKKKP